MKKISMFYFSGTGNTKYAIEKLNFYMNQLEWNSKAISIENISTQEIEKIVDDSDVIILGYPIYGSDLPDIMHDFINALKPIQNKKLGVICTQLLFSGDGSVVERKKLEKLGFKMMWGYQINMFNNLTIKGSPFRHSKGYEENKTKLKKIDNKIKKIADKIDSGEKRIGDDTFFHLLLGLLQRPGYRKIKSSFREKFSCDENKCIKCQKCIRNCPKQAIEFKNDKIKFNSSRCVGCFRCYNFCPLEAIKYNNVTKSPLYKGPTKKIYDEIFK